jgi:hypothetical protein
LLSLCFASINLLCLKSLLSPSLYSLPDETKNFLGPPDPVIWIKWHYHAWFRIFCFVL